MQLLIILLVSLIVLTIITIIIAETSHYFRVKSETRKIKTEVFKNIKLTEDFADKYHSHNWKGMGK